jgi:hypothetical protein
MDDNLVVVGARAAATRIASAGWRQSSGSLSVQPQTVRAIDSVRTVPSASASMTWGWVTARRDQPRWPGAAPLVTFVRWISQEVGL